jgi:hypothetical protein
MIGGQNNPNNLSASKYVIANKKKKTEKTQKSEKNTWPGAPKTNQIIKSSNQKKGENQENTKKSEDSNYIKRDYVDRTCIENVLEQRHHRPGAPIDDPNSETAKVIITENQENQENQALYENYVERLDSDPMSPDENEKEIPKNLTSKKIETQKKNFEQCDINRNNRTRARSEPEENSHDSKKYKHDDSEDQMDADLELDITTLLEEIRATTEQTAREIRLNPTAPCFFPNSHTTSIQNQRDTSTTKQLKFMTWNAGGLKNKLDALIRFMDAQQIHFAIITETWFLPERGLPKILEKASAVAQETPFRYRGSNGVSLLVNPFIKNNIAGRFEIIGKDNLNGQFVAFRIASIIFLGVYYPPSSPNIDTWLDETLQKLCISPTDPLVLLGDFNSRHKAWDDTITNRNGRLLEQWSAGYGFARARCGGQFSFISQHGQSTIDHIISNSAVHSGKTGSKVTFNDEHLPQIASLTIQTDLMSRPMKSIQRIKYEKLSDKETREDFKNSGEIVCSEILCEIEALIELELEPQELADRIEECLNTRLLKFAERKLGRTGCAVSTNYEFLQSPLLLELLRDQENAPTRERQAIIDTEQDRIRKERFLKFAADMNKKPANELMRTMSAIMKRRRKAGAALQNSPESLRLYREHFKRMNINANPASPNGQWDGPPRTPNLATILNPYVTFHVTRILETIQWIAWRKAPGPSQVSGDILKAIGEPIADVLSRIFNIYARLQRIPAQWTRAHLVPVPKKGDLNLIENYRPISLTEVSRKIFEHCLLKHAEKAAGPMSTFQAGFQAGHCCNDAILTLHEILRKRRKEPMHVAFLDIRAAYDSVDRRILWDKCRRRGLCEPTIALLQRLFDHNCTQVMVDGHRSEPYLIEAGVLQGSVLSPFLYSLFIDDLPRTLDRCQKIKVNNASVNILMYADDIALISRTKPNLQRMLNLCEGHASANRYRFNVQKCATLSRGPATFLIGSETIPSTHTFTYLGVEINKNGIAVSDFIHRRIQATLKSANMVRNMGMNVGGFSIRTSSQLYKTFVRSKLEASLCILKPVKKITQLMETAQQKVLSRNLGVGPKSSSTMIRTLFNTPTMAFRWKWLRTSYTRRTEKLPQHFLVKNSMSGPGSWLTQLNKRVFPSEQEREHLHHLEMNSVNNATAAATSNYFSFPFQPKGLYLTRADLPPSRTRILVLWLLKKFPAREPPICANCFTATCTQTHIAECTRLLQANLPNVPPRWRPECAISLKQTPLENIISAIEASVTKCLPYLSFR